MLQEEADEAGRDHPDDARGRVVLDELAGQEAGAQQVDPEGCYGKA